jgi:hypothetical protein
MTNELVLVVDVHTKICMTTSGKDHTIELFTYHQDGLDVCQVNPAASSSDNEGGLGGGGEL